MCIDVPDMKPKPGEDFRLGAAIIVGGSVLLWSALAALLWWLA